MKRFEEAGKQIPMLYAANTSKLVNIMNKLLELVTATLKDEIDIEILEMHDQWKKDAPSGTSKEMGETIAHALGKELSDIAVYGREGVSPREPGTSVIILCAPAIFQVATLYSLVAWENVWKSLTTATTGNVSQEAPATAQHILLIKVLDIIPLRMSCI